MDTVAHEQLAFRMLTSIALIIKYPVPVAQKPGSLFINSSLPAQNVHHFADDIFKMHIDPYQLSHTMQGAISK